MRKYINKQTIAAFLLGAILFSLAPVSAAIEEFILYRADYKLVINGVEFNDPNLPLMNYKGYTVGSVKKILEAAGATVTWNAELGQAEATSNPTSTQINNVEGNTLDKANMKYDPFTGLPEGAVYIDNVKNNREYKTLSYNGKIYISGNDLRKIYGIEYTIDNTFVNKSTNKYITIDFNRDSFAVKAVMYYDFSLFSELTGE